MLFFFLKFIPGLIFIIFPGFSIKDNFKRHPVLTVLSLLFGSLLLILSFSPFFEGEKKGEVARISNADIERIASKVVIKEEPQFAKLRIKYTGIWVALKSLDSNSVDAYINSRKVVNKASYNKGFDIVVNVPLGLNKFKIDVGFMSSMIPAEIFELNIPTSGSYRLLVEYKMLEMMDDSNWKFWLSRDNTTIK